MVTHVFCKDLQKDVRYSNECFAYTMQLWKRGIPLDFDTSVTPLVCSIFSVSLGWRSANGSVPVWAVNCVC